MSGFSLQRAAIVNCRQERSEPDLRTVAKRCARILAEDSSNQQKIEEEIKSVYERRNEIVHGKDPLAARKPFERPHPEGGRSFLFPYLRGYSRRAILAQLFVLMRLEQDQVRREKSPLFRFLSDNGSPIPKNTRHLSRMMLTFADSEEFWNSLRGTINLHSASIGVPFEEN